MTKETGERIGRTLGEVEEVDILATTILLGSTLEFVWNWISHNLCAEEDWLSLEGQRRCGYRLNMNNCWSFATGVGNWIMMKRIMEYGYEVKAHYNHTTNNMVLGWGCISINSNALREYKLIRERRGRLVALMESPWWPTRQKMVDGIGMRGRSHW